MSANPYNAVRYSTLPRQDTHPDRLATVATLLGMTPAPVTKCRMLEVGCGDGSNLVPMAVPPAELAIAWGSTWLARLSRPAAT